MELQGKLCSHTREKFVADYWTFTSFEGSKLHYHTRAKDLPGPVTVGIILTQRARTPSVMIIKKKKKKKLFR